jgi:RNA 2',3'-cyclic 3'-phosphodiesterase
LSRCFLALELDDATRALALEAQRAIEPLGLRKTAEGALHVTIKFLGEVDPEVARRVLGELAPLAAKSAPPLGTTRIDAFPSAARGKIVVLSCADPSGNVAAIAKRADEAAEAIASVPREDRAFHAHVTLARSRTPRDVRAVAERFGERAGGQPTRLVLFESELLPGGPRYTELGAHRFD